jgi:integrase
MFITYNGKRRSKRVGQKSAALEAAQKIEAMMVLGEYNIEPETKAPIFRDYFSMWLDGYIKPLRRQSTYNRYRWVFDKYIDGALGEQPIDKIKKSDIRLLLLAQRKKGLSRSSVTLIRDVVSGPLAFAVDDELLSANPATGILKRMCLERNKRLAVEPLDWEEVNLFLETCQHHWPEHHPFFLCAFRTGMRLGELLALTWGDVDWNRHFIRVNKAYRRGRLEKPKNGRERRVDMSDQLGACLKGLLVLRKKEALSAGRGIPNEILFHRNGKHMEQNFIRWVFKRVLVKAGIREVRIHDIRHTFAGLLLSNGESPVYVKEQLGHSGINTTVDIYGHLIPSSNRQAVNSLDTPHPSAPYTHPVKTERP